MKMIVLRCSIVAVFIFIPLISIQHFIPPLHDCLLADICNHTWIPECGREKSTGHLRLFIDDCDMWEYNCDRGVSYDFTNYSDCFTVTCPTFPQRLVTKVQGYYIYFADGRRMRFVPTTTRSSLIPRTTISTTTLRKFDGRRRYTPEKTRKRWLTTEPCYSCQRNTVPYVPPYVPIRPPPKITTKHTINTYTIKPPIMPTTKRWSQRTTAHTIKILRRTTMGTVVLKNTTVWKNGMLLHKVIKGYPPMITKKKSEKEDSDFLE